MNTATLATTPEHIAEALPMGDPVRCLECRHLRYVRQSDRSTWACPNCSTAPATGQRFTVDPRGARGFGRLTRYTAH